MRRFIIAVTILVLVACDTAGEIPTGDSRPGIKGEPEFSIQGCVDFGWTVLQLEEEHNDNASSPEEFVDRTDKGWSTLDVLDMNKYCKRVQDALKHSDNIEIK